MEILVFFVVALVVAVYGIWRVRGGGSGDDGDPRGALPTFGQAKDDGLLHGGLFGRSPSDAVGKRGEIAAPRRVSRESGHGKDGGG